jgi:hypothetical protein
MWLDDDEYPDLCGNLEVGFNKKQESRVFHVQIIVLNFIFYPPKNHFITKITGLPLWGRGEREVQKEELGEKKVKSPQNKKFKDQKRDGTFKWMTYNASNQGSYKQNILKITRITCH